MSFDLIKERFYYEDDTYRSISIFETTKDDQILIGKYLSQYFSLEINFDKHTTLNTIDEHTIKIMEDNEDYEALINVYDLEFKLIFREHNIDLYFDPSIVDTIEKHNIILDFMNEVSHLLKKKVYLLDFNIEDYFLLEIINIAS